MVTVTSLPSGPGASLAPCLGSTTQNGQESPLHAQEHGSSYGIDPLNLLLSLNSSRDFKWPQQVTSEKPESSSGQKADLFSWEMSQKGWMQSPLQSLPGKHKHSPWRPSRDNICIAQQSKVQPPAMACSHQEPFPVSRIPVYHRHPFLPHNQQHPNFLVRNRSKRMTELLEKDSQC